MVVTWYAAATRDLVGTVVFTYALLSGAGSVLVDGQVVLQDTKTQTEVTCVLQLYQSCDSAHLTFKLFSDRYSTDHRVLNITSLDAGPGFEPEIPMKLLIHGYGGAFDEFNPTGKIKDAYLAKRGFNVVVVDWTTLSNPPCYPIAVVNTWHVGECVAEFLLALEQTYPAFCARAAHVIGFSLGAHVAGFAGNHLFAARGFQLARITGLDPALPLFNAVSDRWKLDATDAAFVDVIHTNVGVFGKVETTGHADFYVNGGTTQKACRGMKHPSLCSHLLAPVYFAESIGSLRGFWSLPCPAYYLHVIGWCRDTQATRGQRVLMGEPCQPGTIGVYLVTTRSRPPYALG